MPDTKDLGDLIERTRLHLADGIRTAWDFSAESLALLREAVGGGEAIRAFYLILSQTRERLLCLESCLHTLKIHDSQVGDLLPRIEHVFDWEDASKAMNTLLVIWVASLETGRDVACALPSRTSAPFCTQPTPSACR